MTERERLRTLVDRLPDGELHTAVRFLEYLSDTVFDPVLQAFHEAPIDEEPLTAEDLAALEEAEQDRAHGRVVSQMARG